MKKITLLLILLTVSLGYSQVIESFDGTAPTFSPDNGECPDDLIGMTISTAQATTGANSLEIITKAAGNPWQGAVLGLATPVDLATNSLIDVDIYATQALGILIKATTGGTDSASLQPHTGSGWETLQFDFTDAADSTVPADGSYAELRIFPLYGNDTGDPYSEAHNAGYAGCVSLISPTIYVDNMVAGTTASTKDFKIAGLSTYPNPTQNSWNIKTQNVEMTSIRVFDVLGKSVISISPKATEATINASSLRTGLYFAKIVTANGSQTVKFIKN